MTKSAKIDLTPVESNSIDSHGYDPQSKTMRVKFRNGRTYDVYDVSPEKYAAFTGNKSLGSYYAQKIKPFHTAKQV